MTVQRIIAVCAVLAVLTALMGCGDDAPVSPRVNRNDDTGFDIGDDDATNNGDNNGATNNGDNNGSNNGGMDAGGDADADTGDVGGDADAEVDADDPGCAACSDDEVCVTNATVEAACFVRDCPDLQCNRGEVCYGGACVSESCAGVDCGGYPNVCRGGVCARGNCSDPDVGCPAGQECVDDQCYTPCTTQSDCGVQACIDGYCQPCSLTAECGGTLVCSGDQCVASCVQMPGRCSGGQVCDADSGQCVAPCTADPDRCASDQICDATSGQCIEACTDHPEVCDANEACDPDTRACVARCTSSTECRFDERCDQTTGLCVAACVNDLDCAADEICDAPSGDCVEQECSVTGMQAECTAEQICLERRCIELSPRFFGNLCAACEKTSSPRYRAVMAVSPVETIGAKAASDRYRLESGVIQILSE